MDRSGLHLFDTPIGRCGIAWRADGRIVATNLPERSEAALLQRLRRRAPDALEVSDTPPAIRDAIAAIQALLRGEPRQLLELDLDFDGLPDFNRQVYGIARAIAPGQTLTYGEVAAKLGGPPAIARAVGQALGANPFAPVVPCHRVLASGAKSGGFSAAGGVELKMRMLAIEGATPNGSLPLFN